MAGKRNSMRRPPRDIISHLPCNIIESILTFLPLHDAARTSILSRKWRYIWVKLPHLVFNGAFCSNSHNKTKEELMMIIYQVLLRHRGPIPEFTLDLPMLMSSSHIDELILYLSNNGIKDLTLCFWAGGPYNMPSSLFSCLELSHLRLRSCVLKSPREFKCFNKLLCLELADIVIGANVLSDLISSCPLLESLKVKSTTDLNGCLKIVAPNLKFLLCQGQFRSILLQHTPYLASCSLSSIWSGESNLLKSFDNISSISHLELNYYYVRYEWEGSVPRQLTTPVNQLRTIKLREMDFSNLYEISNVLCIIRSSPNLEELRIQAFCEDSEEEAPEPIMEVFKIQEWSDVCFNHLREVHFHCVSGKASESMFIQILLAKSPVLETMILGPDAAVSDDGAKILKEVTRFRRLSAVAEISYKELSELEPF